MVKFLFFFKGIAKSYKDNWSIVLILFITCIASIASVNFCYRNGFFMQRQPESIENYNGKNVFAYTAESGTIFNRYGEVENLLGDNQAVSFAFEDIAIAGEKLRLKYVNYGFNDENFITKLQYNKGEKVIVVPNEKVADLGDYLIINNIEYIVVGISDNYEFYVPFNSIEYVNGYITTYTYSQLSRSEISSMEKILGVKYNRDLNYNGGGESTDVSSIMFKIIALVMMIIACINLQKIFKLYLSKNNLRYSLYALTGFSKARLCGTIIGEGAIMIFTSIIFSFFIDFYALRPIIKIMGVEYMYDLYDIILTFGTIFMILMITLICEVFKRIFRQVGDRRYNIKRSYHV